VVVLILISAVTVIRLWLDPDLTKEDWRGAAGVIQQAEQAGDVLVMNAAQTSFPFGYYYQGDLDLRLATFNRDTTPLEEFESGHDRLWLVYRRPFEATHNLARSATFNWQDEENPVLREWLGAHESALVQEVTLPGVYIILYEVSPN
jgi:hypothetical protein